MRSLFTRTMFILVACAIVIVGVAVSARYADAASKKLPLVSSEAISYHVSYNLINSVSVTIADLFSLNSDGLDHQITTSSTGRILVSAQVHITNPAGVAVRGSCVLLISDGTGPTNNLAEMGRPATWYTTDNPAYDLTVPVLGYATKQPGTYNVVVQCQQLGINGATAGNLANMILWELPE